MKITNKPQANPNVILEEEFDGWASLIDKEDGSSYGINPIGVFIWEYLDGCNTIGQIIDNVKKTCSNYPVDVEDYLINFIQDLIDKGLVVDTPIKNKE